MTTANKLLAITISALFLGGCAATDRYGDRVLAYNEQTDDAYDGMLLLNIIRASYQMPTQYMDVSSIVGSNGATLGASVTGSTSPTGSAMAGLAYSSSFTAPVLNTKEFYQGILSPVSPDILNAYFQSSRPLEMVFNLLFDRISVSGTSCGSALFSCSVDFTNDPRNPQNFSLFETMMEYLLASGFTTERVAVKKPKDILNSGKISIFVSSSDSNNDSKNMNADTKAVRYCFHPGSAEAANNVPTSSLRCQAFADKPLERKDVPELEHSLTVKFSEKLADSMAEVVSATTRMGDNDQEDYFRKSINSFIGQPVLVKLRLRSTSAIVEYLGRIIDAQSKRKFNPVLIRDYAIDPVKGYQPCTIRFDAETCHPFFVVTPGSGGAAFSVSYRGTPYSIPSDQRISGNSTYVLATLKQLFALNNSAKTAPVPAILTGIPAL